MEIFIFLIPFVVAAFLLIFFRKQTTWWEYFALIIPSILVGILLEFVFKQVNADDTEYLGSYVTKVRHYDSWNEYIHRTCTKTVGSGKDEHTVTYDCSYVENHPEYWTYYNARGKEEYFMNKDEFDIVRKKLKTSPVFVDMNRNYYTKDGDAQDWYWDNSIENAYTLTSEHQYKNKVKASRSIFKFEDISKEEAKKLGLYEYPNVIMYDQRPIMGLKFPQEQEKTIRWLNGFYGEQKQFRVFLLFFKNKPEEIVEKQRSYWQGGNKNELVVCIGIDSKCKVKWCEAFSWCDSPVVAVKSRDWFINHPLNLCKFAEYIEPVIKAEWHRKSFSDFDYLTIELSDGQYYAIIVLLLIFNIFMSAWIVNNEYTNDSDENQDGQSPRKRRVSIEIPPAWR